MNMNNINLLMFSFFNFCVKIPVCSIYIYILYTQFFSYRRQKSSLCLLVMKISSFVSSLITLKKLINYPLFLIDCPLFNSCNCSPCSTVAIIALPFQQLQLLPFLLNSCNCPPFSTVAIVFSFLIIQLNIVIHINICIMHKIHLTRPMGDFNSKLIK